DAPARGPLRHQGPAQHASHADPALERAKGVFRIALGVIDEHGRIFEKDARTKGSATRLVSDVHDSTVVIFRQTEARRTLKTVTNTTMDDDDVGLAQTSCRFRKSV